MRVFVFLLLLTLHSVPLIAAQGKFEPESDSLNFLLQNEPEWSDSTIGALYYYNSGIAQIKEERFDSALFLFEKAIQLSPDHFKAWDHKGEMLLHLNRPADAVTAYKRATDLQPERETAWIGLGLAYALLEQWEQHLNAMENAIALNPKIPLVWYNKGLALGELDRSQESIEAFEQTIALKPQHFLAWHNMGVQLERLNRTDEAIAAYNAALKIKPQSEETIYNKARCHATMHHKPDMLASLAAAIQRSDAYRFKAKTNRGFEFYWNDPDFKALVGE